MILKTEHNYNRIFVAFLLSVVFTFFYLRPLKSPWHPFIAGDGLGYYAYLPAIFIYHDADLKFAWFNKVYNDNYVTSSFNNPEDNFLVNYNGQKINKYYQGLSFIWMPFFLAGHLAAKIFYYPADGFSWPYQWAMGLASLFYLLLALYFLRRLLNKVLQNQLLACLIPVFIFYGTHLFSYAIFQNTLSHVFSFCFNILVVYFASKAFNEKDKIQFNFVLAILFYFITVAIRPLNALMILLLPILFTRQNIKTFFELRPIKTVVIVVLLLINCLIAYQFSLMYKQTHSFLPYTYSNEHFDFLNNRFVEALFSYNIGLFVYVPIIFLSLFGIFKLPNSKWLILAVFFIVMVFIYSAWWYWPINRRALIDYYFIPAILIGFYVNALKKQNSKSVFFGLIIVSTLYYQLKNYQMQKGILDEFTTYKEIYWRNFFRLEKANMYLINPASVLNKEEHFFDFENETLNAKHSGVKIYSGKKSILISAKNNFCILAEVQYPKLFESKRAKTIRFSLQGYFEDGISKAHLFIQFFNKENRSVLDVPFYLNQEDVLSNRWDLKEFGFEITDTTLINSHNIDKIGISIWNVKAKGNVYVDDLKLEFILTKPE